ncbi:hypothetical protein AAC387_Pa06g1932 [Persea americana]
MAVQTQNLLFLEEWLRNKPPPSPSSPPTSAKTILQAWSDLRDCLQTQTFKPQYLSSLLTLRNSQQSLYVADPQAKLLLSLLSNPNISLPQSSLPLLLRLLYIWVRKSSKPSSALLDSSVPIISGALSTFSDALDYFLVSEAILLLGSLSMVPILSESPKRVCLDLLCKLLDEELARAIGLCGDVVPEVLAGIGYALVRCESTYFGRIFSSLMGIWRFGPCACVPHGVMILQLMEWLVFGLINSRFLERIEFICREISEFRNRNFIRFAVVMGAAGVSRAFNRTAPSGSVKISFQLRKLVEDSIDAVAGELVSKMGDFSSLSGDFEHRLLLQCISLGLARSGLVSFSAPALLCLTSALLIEIFPLQSFYRRIIENQDGSSAILGMDEVKKHLDSVLFKEVGAVTGAFCNQYDLADEQNKLVVENYVWNYCLENYSNHRSAALLLRSSQKELLLELEKIAEAAFLMVVLFASSVAKHKVSSKFSRESQSEASVNILVAFSRVEYLRRVRLPEYSDTIRRVVFSVKESDLACISFVESMPPYCDLTNHQGSREIQYAWHEDEVQTARILFYLRVIPTCIERIPHHVFRKTIAPVMFLYIRHPSGKVAGASHSVFVAFISSRKDNQDDRVLLKEQLVFYYIQRALEAYPGITPYEGIASGVAAVVRNVPAGSPAIFYCIHSLVEKATLLCSEAVTRERNMWKNWQGNSEPSKKMLEFLLRLVALVDIQVLPNLLKLLAQLIAQLPKDGQNVVLDEAYSLIAESDDVTRKPILVSWVQSLSFLCSQKMAIGGKREAGVISRQSYDTLRLNVTSSRL